MAKTNNNIYDTIRTNVKKYRKLKNMTQQDLADASGLSHGYIREIESFKMQKTFSLEAVASLAKGLDIDISCLFEESIEK